MNSQKILGIFLALIGAGALTYSVFTLVEGQLDNIETWKAWEAVILGLMFIVKGIGLFTTAGSSGTKT